MNPTSTSREPAVAQPTPSSRDRIGAVAIGRNEGERLKRCLNSLTQRVGRVIYVDSGSTDGSAEWARSHGVEVVELDLSTPFTAARARNTGWRALESDPSLEFVQFIDGDCELVGSWTEDAVSIFEARPEAGAVGGVRRELRPDASIYNRLTDIEWIKIPGDDVFFLGDVMVRMEALRRSGGFDDSVLAGEEAEFGVRLKDLGYRLVHIDREMSRHDISMTRFGQWWRRSVRTGHAYLETAAIHGAGPHRHHVGSCLRAVLWGVGWPLAMLLVIALGLVLGGWWWAAVAIPPLAAVLNIAKTAVGRHRRFGTKASDASIFAVFCFLAKFAHVLGMVEYLKSRWRRSGPRLIEYR